VLGTVLFRCALDFFFFFENFLSLLLPISF
jgi:hypothetical protein